MCLSSHLIRIFNNLINNAIQALKEDTPGSIHVMLKTKGHTAIISVRDNGIGISKEKAGNIFMPNFTTKSGGSGLGLAISKKLIESMDGDIYFESVQNQGTSFFVSIPISS
jgi:signal transduction histidine kinase